ncbi:MAG: M23 family metallopeptidase [Bacteroidia bacterium]|nr:M23 family metallopeptidase [Bacteroidia bacterium]
MPFDISQYQLSSLYGHRTDPISHQASFHAGIDLPAVTGAKVYATADGRITGTGYEPAGLGMYVVVQHAFGFETIYGHLSGFCYEVGTKLRRGQCLGYVGSTGYSTGPHLHYTIKKNGRWVDPLPFCRGMAKFLR